MHADYSCWLRVARDWRDGAVLYRDTYDNKSPWVYRWLRAVDSSRPEISCFLAETTLAVLGAIIFRAALKPSFPATADLAPLLLIVWSGTSGTFYGGQSTEALALWWDVAALSCWVIAAEKGSPALACAAGACLFVAAGLRPPAVVDVVAWLPFLALMWRRHPRAVAWRTVSAACGGALGMLGLFLLDAVASGTWSAMTIVFDRNRSYGSLERAFTAPSALAMAATGARIASENPCAGVFTVMTLVVWWRPPRKILTPQKCWYFTALLWFLAALASALPGGRHYAHYYHLIWPSLSVLATLWLTDPWSVGPPTRWHGKLIVGLAVGSVLVALVEQSLLAAKAWRDLGDDSHPRIAVREAAAFLEETTSPNTPVVVHVWGDWAELYWRVPRPTPSFDIPHVLPASLFAEWITATLTHPPDFVVWDGTPWEPVDGPAEAEEVERLTSLLSRQYKEIKRFGPLSIFERVK